MEGNAIRLIVAGEEKYKIEAKLHFIMAN